MSPYQQTQFGRKTTLKNHSHTLTMRMPETCATTLPQVIQRDCDNSENFWKFSRRHLSISGTKLTRSGDGKKVSHQEDVQPPVQDALRRVYGKQCRLWSKMESYESCWITLCPREVNAQTSHSSEGREATGRPVALFSPDLFRVTLHDGNIQEFGTRRDEVLLSVSKIPSDEILESLCKLRIRESDPSADKCRTTCREKWRTSWDDADDCKKINHEFYLSSGSTKEFYGWSAKTKYRSFSTPSSFSCWKTRFKIQVSSCSDFPLEVMSWIKEVEMIDSTDDFKIIVINWV